MTLLDRIVAALATAAHPLRADELAERVYADDPDGGPLTAENVITVTIAKSRRAGDGRVLTVRDGYVLEGRSYGPRPPDWRIAEIAQLRRSGLRWCEVADRIGITSNYAQLIARRSRAVASTHAL